MAMFKALHLTPEQEKALQGVLDRHKAAVNSREQAAAEKEDAVRDAMEDPGVPEAKLRTLNLVASEARMQAMLEHRATVLEINALLTPDQLAKARRIREDRQRERDARRALAAELDDGQAPPPGGPGL
jgi:Spy/CpxP family protein refolding chaperone